MGGKMRLGKELARIIQSFNPVSYHEPFCGMFSVGKHVVCAKRTAGDAHPDLILMLKAVQAGWEPPSGITEEQYAAIRNESPSYMRGFIGFGSSFYGKFFGGFARDAKHTDYSDLAKRNLLKLAPLIQGVTFVNQLYNEYTGDADVIYCDPPYAGTTDYSNGVFDSARFWDWVRTLRPTVLISEYQAPNDFEIVWEKPVTTSMHDKAGKGIQRIERLFKRKA
jgi:DNA adenine methylase